MRRGYLTPVGVPPDCKEEADGISKQDVVTASLIFERTRAHFREELRAILEYVFEKKALPKLGGLDIGSGATGEMVNELLPFTADQRRTWVQMDVNPDAVAANNKRHPENTIMHGSYLDMHGTLNLPDDSLDIVTGLSSLDATRFLPQAIAEIRRVLKRGGYLVHMQDVRPGLGFGFDEMARRGTTPPFDAELLPSGNNGGMDPIAYHTSTEGLISVGECFRRGLGRAISTDPEMELLTNNWFTARRSRPQDQPTMLYGMNVRLDYIEPGKSPFKEASAVVTIARKKAA